MCFFKKRKAKKAALEAEKQQKVEQKVVKSEPIVEQNKVEEKVEKPVQDNKKETAVVKKAEAPTPKKATQEIASEEDDAKNDVISKNAKYHVSQNKDSKSENFKNWRVRKEGSNKTIKYFSTQKEAIDYAQDLADKAGSSVVIHKLDGSIRKQDYAKK